MKKAEDYISSGILEQFVLEGLSAAETQEVLDMAARYPAVRDEIALIEDTLQGLAETLAIKPPPQVLDRIKDKISESPPDTEVPQAKKTKKLYYWQYGVAATFTLKVVVMAFAANFWIHWQNTERKLSNVQEQYSRLEQDAQQVTQALMAISDPAFETVVLQDQASASGARVLTYWNKNTQQLYVNPSQLPPNDEDEQYQLWGTTEGNTVSLGVFDVAATTSLPQIISLKGVEGLSSLSISLEPEGGSASPSQERVYTQVNE